MDSLTLKVVNRQGDIALIILQRDDKIAVMIQQYGRPGHYIYKGESLEPTKTPRDYGMRSGGYVDFVEN